MFHLPYTKEKDAKKARDLTVAELYGGTFVVDETLKVKEFLSEWHETVIRKKKATTYSSYHYQLKNHIYPALGNLKLTDLNKGHLIKFYENVSRKSYSSAKNCRVILLTALRYAVGKKLIPENPAEGIYVPKSENDKKKEKQKQYRTINIDSQSTLTVEQLKLLIEKAKATKIYMYILFAGLMGLRKSEILGLKYSDIDFTSVVPRMEDRRVILIATKDIKSFCRIMDFLTYDSMICGIRMLQYFQMRKLM